MEVSVKRSPFPSNEIGHCGDGEVDDIVHATSVDSVD